MTKTLTSERHYEKVASSFLPLTSEQEKTATPNKLIEHNLTLVIRIAKMFANRGMSLDDLIGEGNLGLIKAANKYDPNRTYVNKDGEEKNIAFRSYATWWIRQKIKLALKSKTRIVRVPDGVISLLTKWEETKNKLKEYINTEPSIAEISTEMGLTKKQTEAIIKAQASCASFVVNDDNKNPNKADLQIKANGDSNILETLLKSEKRIELNRRMDTNYLTEKEKQVIHLRFFQKLKLREIGEKLGNITRERVRQIEANALKKLKKVVAE